MIDKAIKSMAQNKLERTIRTHADRICQAALVEALREIQEALVVKLVPNGNDTFSVEFAWKSLEGDEGHE